ncbi:MAG TPA: hypothetical protein VN961_01015, partial [Streptosporangiaceae bacterium]|nr:hypothetical protein [Streptosporangiaceae bacterium]
MRLITPKPAAFIDHGAIRELPGVVRRTGAAAAVSVDSGAASSDSGGVTLVAAGRVALVAVGGGSPIDA